ncbi:hypothetical protein [Oligoflexus tunisiensis]|uniref:hypothetical protein n=1 Tax=Oligoflexus tunisiensis TaxID=708132 RepID=UPI001C4079F4|nr:hypothetical protein [Oligoflexus tunisiensis]
MRSRKVFANAGILFGVLTLVVEGAIPLQAAEFKGDARIGHYSRQVEFKGAYLGQTAGETNNDEQVINLQLKASAEDLNDSGDRFIFDFRDKRDGFGKLERENLLLSNYERRQLRLAAYQRPWESNRTYFTVGRFSLPEANIIANDGAEFGYRTSRSSRYGAFAGQGAKDIIAPLYVDPDTRDISTTQFGAYYNYESKDTPEDSSYLTNAVAQAPTYDITDADSHLYYYQQGLFTFGGNHRIGSLVQFDFAPKSSLRRGYLSYYYQTERLRAGGYLNQTTTEDYLIKQVIQDVLVPSSVRTIDLDARYRLSSAMSVDVSASQGTRTVDGKVRTEYTAGLLFPRVLGDTSSTRLQVGTRQNFLSKDNFTKIAYDYWGATLSVGLSYTLSTEDYDDGTTNKRTIMMVDAGIFVLDDIRGALGYELESDSKVDASALFIMFGYKFGKSASSPRTRPARFEEM